MKKLIICVDLPVSGVQGRVTFREIVVADDVAAQERVYVAQVTAEAETYKVTCTRFFLV